MKGESLATMSDDSWLPLPPLRACLLVWLATSLSVPASSSASWPEMDARAMARGGMAALHVPTQSPAAPLRRGLSFLAGAGSHFLGSGLASRRVQCSRAGERSAWCLGIEQLRSDVHREEEGVAVLQRRWHRARLGLALGWRQWHFLRHETHRRAVLRLGLGVQPMAPLQVVWMGEAGGQGDGELRCVVSAGVALQPGLEAALQVEREPALPPRLRASLGWRLAAAWGVVCGYDAGTSGVSTGMAIEAGSWNLVCAAATHPELGWSHAVQLEWRP